MGILEINIIMIILAVNEKRNSKTTSIISASFKHWIIDNTIIIIGTCSKYIPKDNLDIISILDANRPLLTQFFLNNKDDKDNETR